MPQHRARTQHQQRQERHPADKVGEVQSPERVATFDGAPRQLVVRRQGKAGIERGGTPWIRHQQSGLQVSGEVLARDFPSFAIVGAPVQAAVGGDQDDVPRHGDTTGGDRRLRKWRAQGPPPLPLIVRLEHLPTAHRPETIGIRWIKTRDLDAPRRKSLTARLPAPTAVGACPQKSAGHRVDLVRATRIHQQGTGVFGLSFVSDIDPGLPPVVTAVESGPPRQVRAAAHRS